MNTRATVSDFEPIIAACDEGAAKDFLANRYFDLPLDIQDHLAFAHFKAARDGSSSEPDDKISACDMLSSVCARLKRDVLA